MRPWPGSRRSRCRRWRSLLSGASSAGTVNLIFMALGSLPFLYVFFSARYAPRPLVSFGMLTYVLALVSAFASILGPGSPLDQM